MLVPAQYRLRKYNGTSAGSHLAENTNRMSHRPRTITARCAGMATTNNTRIDESTALASRDRSSRRRE